MNNTDILTAIEKKLTGNLEEDVKFVLKEADHFRKLEAFEMVDEIMKILEKHYGDEAKKYLVEKATENIQKRHKMYKDAIEFEKNNEYLKAQEIIVKLIDTFPTRRPLGPDVKLVSFNNLFEHLYFTMNFQNHDQIYRLEEPYANYYFHLGYILFQLGDYEGSLESLETSISYNCVYVDAVILKSECHYKLGQTDKFLSGIDAALENAYNKYQVANCYYLLANYYTEIENKLLAQACCHLSRNFLHTKDLDNVFKKTLELAGPDLNPKDISELKQLFDDAKIQFGPSTKVLKTFIKIINDPKTKENPMVEFYFTGLIFELTNDPQFKAKLEELKPIVRKIKNESQKNKSI